MDWLSEKIDSLLTWFADAFKSIFDAVVNLLKDFVVWVLDALLSGVAFLLESIPVPAFMSQGLASLFSSLPPSLVYLMDATGLFQALGIVGAGVAFNLVRKLVTLGQW